MHNNQHTKSEGRSTDCHPYSIKLTPEERAKAVELGERRGLGLAEWIRLRATTVSAAPKEKPEV